MEKGIIDRFEGNLAVIEFDSDMRDIPKKSYLKVVKLVTCLFSMVIQLPLIKLVRIN